MINTLDAVKDELSQGSLESLLCAYARLDAPRHRLLWVFDARIAQLARTTSEPIIGQMRVAWWDEALRNPTTRGAGEPLIDALRRAGMAQMPALFAMLDGWEALLENAIDQDVLRRFAEGRGGGLFRALAGDEDVPSWLIASGRLWALWDLAGHLRPDDPARGQAIKLARAELPAVAQARWPRRWKPLRIATGLARHDVSRGIVPGAGLTPRLYARLLRLAVLGG